MHIERVAPKKVGLGNPFPPLIFVEKSLPMPVQKIFVEGQEITIKSVNETDYISLTDMANWDQHPNAKDRIRNWLKNGNTLAFLKVWERHNNPDFNYVQMDAIRMAATESGYILTPKRYIASTQAIGIQSKAGRYGGTFAHRDIAFEFATWLNAEFKYYLITEFQRLKSDEAKRLDQEYEEMRFLTKVNYSLQTKAIQENILPRLSRSDQPFAYANEADLLNLVVFGMTAKQWREKYPDAKGNLRDFASILELNILNNLQARNAELIDNGVEAELRFKVLLQIAQKQFERLAEDDRLGSAKEQKRLE